MKSVSKSNDSIEVGSVVIVQTTAGSKNGVIKYIGETKFAAGEWIGVRLDGPEGKNDGTVSGEKYFDCEPLHGLFVKRAQVKLESKSSSSSTAAAATTTTAAVAATTTTTTTAATSTTALSAREKYEQLKAKRLAGTTSTKASTTAVDSKDKDKEKIIEKAKVKEKVKEKEKVEEKIIKKELEQEVVKETREAVEKEVVETISSKEESAVQNDAVVEETNEIVSLKDTSEIVETISSKEESTVQNDAVVKETNETVPFKDASDNRDGIKSDNTNKDNINEDFRNQIENLTSQLTQSKDEYRSLAESLAQSKAHNEKEAKRWEDTLLEKDKELSAAKATMNEERGEKEGFEKRLVDKEKEMSAVITKYEEEISRTISKHKNDIADKEKEIREMATSLSTKNSSSPLAPSADINAQTLRETENKYSSIIDGKDSEIKKLQTEMKDVVARQEATSNELVARKSELEKLSKEYELEKKKNNDADVQLKENKYSSIIDGKDSEIKKLQTEMKDAVARQEVTSNELVARKSELEKLSKEYELEKKKNNDADVQLKELKENLEKVSKSNSSAAPKVEQLQAQIDELNDNLELLTLDKEQLTLDKEILEEKITSLEQDLSVALDSDNNTGAAAYAEENAKLRAALLKLNALSNEERTLSERNKKDLDELSGAVKQREQEVAALREFKSTAANEISDLKAHVDATALYEEMIEKLTDKNEQLAARNINLEEAIRDLEATVEVSEELDISQREEIAKLNKAVDAAEVAKILVEEQYKALQMKFEETAEIINKFRRSADSLKGELSQTQSKYEEAVVGSSVSGDLLRESNILKIKYAALVEKMIATEKSKKDLESSMWSTKVYNSRYDEIFSSLSLTVSEKKRLSSEVFLSLATYKSASLFNDLSGNMIDFKTDEIARDEIAHYSDIYVILMKAITGLWQLSLKAMTEDIDSIMIPSALSDFVVEIDKFSTTGGEMKLSIIRAFVSQTEDVLPPSLSSLLDECFHHCTPAAASSNSHSLDLSAMHVMIHISALANLILFASSHLSATLTLIDIEIANVLKSITLETQELLDCKVKLGPSTVVSMRNLLCNAFNMLNKIVELAKSNQDSSVVFVNLKTALSFIRNAANLLKTNDKEDTDKSIDIFNIARPQNIWKMVLDGSFVGSENLRWKKAIASAKLTLGSWEESEKGIKGSNESLEKVNISLTLRSDELRAAKAANEELLGLLNKENEEKSNNGEIIILQEAIGVLEGRCANLENENRQLKKTSKLSMDTKVNTTAAGPVDSSLVYSLTLSRLTWKKMATLRMATSLLPLPNEARFPPLGKSVAEENINKINRIARKARASIKIVSLNNLNNRSKNNNEYNNIDQLKECFLMLAAC